MKRGVFNAALRLFRMTRSMHQATATDLMDNFGRKHNYLRMSLTEKCNLRCVYCMPADGVILSPKSELLTFDERCRVISICSKVGINKIRFTGGEPTVSNQLLKLISHSSSNCCNIKSIGITTNGILLGKNNALFDDLISAGLTSVNISLDTLTPKRFADISRRSESLFYTVLSFIHYAVSKPNIKVKLNCVLMKGINDDELHEFAYMSKSMNIDCRFIEIMPFDGNEWSREKLMSYTEAISKINISPRLFTLQRESVVDDPHDTTKWYRGISTADGSEFTGRVGFITSMTSNFCSTCNRLRVTADGNLKNCLFGEDSLNIRDSLREGKTDEQVIDEMRQSIRKKHASLGGHSSPENIASSNGNRPMILIGG